MYAPIKEQQLSYLTRDLPPELKRKAKEELGEDPYTLDEDIQRLRSSVLKVEGLTARTDDAFLLRFLRAKKFDQERALDTIKNYYKQRQKNPHIFDHLSAKESWEGLSSNFVYALPERDKEGRAVIVYNIANWDPTKVSIDELTAIWLLCLERLVENQDVQINGIITVSDLEGLGMNHILYMTPFAMRRMLAIIIDSFPIRYKQINVFNEPKIYDLLYMIVKPFLSQKIRDRFILHGNSFELFHEQISPSFLPEKFEGLDGPFDCSEWNKILLENDSVIISNREYGYQAGIFEPDVEDSFPEIDFNIDLSENDCAQKDPPFEDDDVSTKM